MHKRPKPYERPQTDQTYQDIPKAQRKTERSFDGGDLESFHQDLSSSTPVPSGFNSTVERAKPLPGLLSPVQYPEGDKGSLLYSDTKRENNSESSPLIDSLETLVKVEATSDSDVEVTGVDNESSALDFSKSGHQAVGYLPDYGN